MAAQTTFEKPRRLDEETADYLKQVESQWKGDMTEEDREILIANVLTEIKTRTASALSDRNTNIFLEKICTECSLKYLVDVINRCIPYAVFLARDRYGSHVLQVIIISFLYHI